MTDNNILLEKAKRGDKNACNELTVNNMKLVGSIAARFLGRGYEWEELSQVGAIGLMRAIEKFDTSYNVKFSTYAVPVIMGEIKRFLRDDGMIKISRSIKETAAKGKKYAEELRIKMGREPTIAEISAESGIAEDELVEAFDASLPVESIIVSDENGNERELGAAASQEEEILNKILVSDMLESLENRERQIMILRYYNGKTQTETAKIIGVSQVQISRIEKSVLKKLRENFSK